MSTTEVRGDGAKSGASTRRADMKLEVVVIPVADVDRAAEFYGEKLGWRVDADFKRPGGRLLQFTPPGSPCSIIFGTGITPSPPGSAQFLHLVVSDIEAAREELVRNGVDASEVFHDAGGGYNRFDPAVRASGPDPERRTYASFVVFNDPDGNGWLLQEITARFAGRIDSDETAYVSVPDLASALRRAEAAHGEHEKRTGQHDAEWADWYAAYMVAEQSGTELPLQWLGLASSPSRWEVALRMIEVGVYPTRSEAELAQTALAVEGIQSVIEADDAGGAYPFDLTGGARLLVGEGDAAFAAEILAGQQDQMGLVALTAGCFTLGACIGRDTSGAWTILQQQ